MSDSFNNLLIKTKLHFPRKSPNIIERPRLINKLHLCIKYKLTLIYSPIGFGKTTLLSSWIEHIHFPTAWISLDERDTSPKLFLLYILAALQRIDPTLGCKTEQLLVNDLSSSMNTILTSLVNEISEYGVNFILIFDDYHTINNPEIHEIISFLLEYLPYQMHLIITSRKRLPFSLAELRAKNDLLEITTRDLRFTREETSSFLATVSNVHLTSEDVDLLEKRTEGWITGLQLAALNLKEPNDLPELLDNFAGDNLYVAEYLFEEIFNKQDDDLKDYLLKTSILSELSASLCDAVTERDDSQELLRMMGRSDLLIFSLDSNEEWYIAHTLFRDFLQSRLEERYATLVSVLHDRAALWYKHNGMLAEAVRHAAYNQNYDQIAEIIERNSPQMIARGELSTLQSWLEILPPSFVRQRDQLILTQAWVLTLLERQLDDAEKTLTYLTENSASEPERNQEIVAEATAIRANIACLRGDVEVSIELSNQALDLFYQDDSQLRGQVISNLSRAYRLRGDFQSWANFIKRLGPASRSSIDYETRHYLIKGLATLYMAQGELIQAENIWQEGLTLIVQLDKNGLQPISSIPYIMLGKIYFEWNQLDQAQEMIEKGLEIAKRGDYSWSLRHGYIILARILQIRNRDENAVRTIEKALRSGSSLDPVWTDRETEAYRAWLLLNMGEMDEVRSWVKDSRLNIYSDFEHSRKFEYLVYCRYLLAINRPDDARFMLDRFYEMAKETERINTLMEILPLRAATYFACEDLQRALNILEEAILLGERNKYTRTFIDNGTIGLSLLQNALAAGIQSEIIMRLLTQAGEDVSVLTGDLLQASPLSAREIEISRLFTTYHSSAEIALILDISTHTVRTHIKNIYSKLDVHSRSEAIDRLRVLKLIQ